MPYAPLGVPAFATETESAFMTRRTHRTSCGPALNAASSAAPSHRHPAAAPRQLRATGRPDDAAGGLLAKRITDRSDVHEPGAETAWTPRFDPHLVLASDPRPHVY
jgi:hypothetical protein